MRPFSVYPRWRGELFYRNAAQDTLRGLSPLARGTPQMTACLKRKQRFIPAGAGNSAFLRQIWRCCAVYPRWRGELLKIEPPGRAAIGLSPLARGTLELLMLSKYQLRFIPAGAGNSANNRPLLDPTTVYPRWRGELAENSQNNAITAGLSPLARGTQQQQYFPQCCQRFIPAGAGNSRPAARQRDTRTVYPRWRGELNKPGIALPVGIGLSPLARGTL